MLFSAALGRAGLRSILKALEKEAAALFKPEGKTPGRDRVIAETAKEFKIALKKAQDSALPVERWEQHDVALRNAQSERARVLEQSAALAARMNRLERLRQALPAAAARKSRLEELAAVGEVVALRPEFPEERAAALRSLEQASAEARAIDADLTAISAEIESVHVHDDVLAHETIIESVYQRIGGFLHALGESSELNKKRAESEDEAAKALETLGWQIPLHELEALRTTPAQRAHIQDLATQRQALYEKLEARRQERRRLEADLESARADLARLPAPRSAAELTDAVERTRKEGDLDHELAAAVEAAGKLEKQAQIQLTRFPTFKGGLEQIEKLS
jgi:uncharacterized protein YhaN